MKQPMKNRNKLTLIVSTLALAGILIGCTTTKVTEEPPGSGQFSTNHVVDPKLTTGLQTVGAVNEATRAVNPFAPLVDIGLAAALAIAAFVAKRKNDQASQAKLLLKTVIQGVETADNQEVKAVIEKHAVNVGVEGKLSGAVARVNAGVD
jgi:hypothetical protein